MEANSEHEDKMEENREHEGEGAAEETERQPSYKIMTVEEYEQEQADKEKQERAAKERNGQVEKEASEREKAEKEKAEKERIGAKERADADKGREAAEAAKPVHPEKPAAAPEISQASEGRQAGEGGRDNSTKYFLIIAAVVVVLTVAFFSMRAIKTGEKYETVKYNGFVFERYSGLWNTQWKQDGQVFNLRLHYNPYQVENISIIGDEGWSAKENMFITFDPEGSETFSYTALAAAELSLSLSNAFGITPVAACTENVTAGCASRPVVACGSAPDNSSVIYLKDDSSSAITLEGSCATIQGSGEELVRAAEKAIYQWYGIIRPE